MVYFVDKISDEIFLRFSRIGRATLRSIVVMLLVNLKSFKIYTSQLYVEPFQFDE